MPSSCVIKVVFFSGGACSYCAAKRVIENVGKENVVLLFTDTKIEDEDLYRFIDEAAEKLGAELIKIADGRTPFEVYRDSRFLGNNRLAPCSHILKQKTAHDYIFSNYEPEETKLYLGLDWTETHRFNAPRKNWAPFKVEYPMSEAPYLSKVDMLEVLKADGIEPPRLYAMGFAHNNCGGFCCRADDAEGMFEELKAYMAKHIAFVYTHDIHGGKIAESLKDIAVYSLIGLYMAELAKAEDEEVYIPGPFDADDESEEDAEK